MTRNEVRKQAESGWVTRGVATLLMGFDLDVSKLDSYTECGTIDTRKSKGVDLVKLDDILAFVDLDLNDLLDKYFPVNRQKKGDHAPQVQVLDTREKQDEFHGRWFRLHRHVSGLIADPKEKFDFRELKLIYQLMEWSRRTTAFVLVLDTQKLLEATRLDSEWLPKTRRKLEGRGLIQSERNGTLEWIYTLLNPKTNQPFDEFDKHANRLSPSSSWAQMTGDK